jgi:SulP family sulfate permease
MAEKAEFVHLLRTWPTATVLLATFGLTLAADLGCIAAVAISYVQRRRS